MNKVIYLYGQPGSGKTTLGRRLAEKLWPSLVVDGDTIRNITGNKNYGISGRIQNLETAHNIALLALDQKLNVILGLVSPYNEMRSDFAKECKMRGVDVRFVQLMYDKNIFHRGKDSYWVEGFQEMKQGVVLNTGYLSVDNCLEEILKY